jgi:uncharacterized membrane protein
MSAIWAIRLILMVFIISISALAFAAGYFRGKATAFREAAEMLRKRFGE